MFKNLVLPCLLISFLFFGCDDEPVSPEEIAGRIQPLAVGNEWHFIDSIYKSGTVSTGETIIKVSAKSVLSGEEVFNWQVFGGNQLLRTNLVNTGVNGLWHYGEIIGSDSLFIKKQWAKYPVQIGESFTEPRFTYDDINHSFSQTDTWTWTCINKDYIITLQDGTKIKCIVFKTVDKTGSEVNILYSENIGYAGWITIVNGEVVFKETLSTYLLK